MSINPPVKPGDRVRILECPDREERVGQVYTACETRSVYNLGAPTWKSEEGECFFDYRDRWGIVEDEEYGPPRKVVDLSHAKSIEEAAAAFEACPDFDEAVYSREVIDQTMATSLGRATGAIVDFYLSYPDAPFLGAEYVSTSPGVYEVRLRFGEEATESEPARRLKIGDRVRLVKPYVNSNGPIPAIGRVGTVYKVEHVAEDGVWDGTHETDPVEAYDLEFNDCWEIVEPERRIDVLPEVGDLVRLLKPWHSFYKIPNPGTADVGDVIRVTRVSGKAWDGVREGIPLSLRFDLKYGDSWEIIEEAK